MIKIDNLRMMYRSGTEQVVAVDDVSLEIKQGQFFTLLGPSGCGKTTTLRCVAGLETPDSGEIGVGNDVVFSSSRHINVPPFRRNIGMVFQSYAIWPHMSVFDNVAFPLLHATPRPSRKQILERVLQALSLVQLVGLEDRPAPYLSGGQQQRLALARALVGEPSVLLLDEPLSNLDAKLREEMRVELRDLVKRLNVTTLFVTHEQIEALAMSDVVAVMQKGKIVQAGTPLEIYTQPQGLFVAEFIGRTNLIRGRVSDRMPSGSAGVVPVETPIATLMCRSLSPASANGSAIVAVRPEDIRLAKPDGSDGAGNTVNGQVERLSFLGETVDCFVRVGESSLMLRLHPSMAPEAGAGISLFLPPESCLVLPDPDGQAAAGAARHGR